MIFIKNSEKLNVMRAIKQTQGQKTSIADIATRAGYNPNRVRFIVDALIAEGYAEKRVQKQFNDKYIRYTYHQVKEM